MIATSSILLKFLFNYIFISKLGWQIGGITLSTSLVTLYNAVALGILISSKVKMAYKDLFVNLLKMTFVGLLTLGITFISAKMMAQYNIFVRLVVVSIEILAVYIGLSCIFKVNYINEMLNRILGKFKRA